MPDATSAPTLDGAALEFVTATPLRFGTLSTINPDGSPHQAVVWYVVRADGGIMFNSRIGRRWPSNLLRDPRCSMTVEDRYHWVSVRGEVEAIEDHEQACADICDLATRYHADDPAERDRMIGVFRTQDRISFVLRPRGVSIHL